MITVTLSHDFSRLGPDAKESDLRVFRRNLEVHLCQKFAGDIQVRLGSLLETPTCEDADIQQYVQALPDDVVATLRVHPLRGPVLVAQEQKHAAAIASCAASTPEAHWEALRAEEAARVALSEACAALADSDCPREWRWFESDADRGTCIASSAPAALQEATVNLQRLYELDTTRTLTAWVTLRVACTETDEAASARIALLPPVPACTDERPHDFRRPVALVGPGADARTPGVTPVDKGVLTHEVCVRCGCSKKTITEVADPETGEGGFTTVTYKPHEFASQLRPR